MNETILVAPENPIVAEAAGAPGTTTAGPSLPHDREWLVELIARTWLEPALAARYRADARAVLDEFGVTLDVGEPAPALPESPVCELSIEELTRPTTAHAGACLTWEVSAAQTAAENRAVRR
ncbi:TIGR04351 family putative TOMM peptide [Streptomyces sp. NPDC001985]|uniref:TIGR04351 family putative TOMM peptide n=1 Tax=Streptomyces sp. NPDC001985 TaxID=3154406 RepID=UPI0033241C91